MAEDAIPEWIDIGTVAEMLGVNESLVWRLAKLHPKYTPFRSPAVEKLVRSHIFVPEISRQTGIDFKRSRLEGKAMVSARISYFRPAGSWVFLREEFEPNIAAWLKLKEAPRTEPHSYDTKTRVIATVEGGASVSEAARREKSASRSR